MTTHALHKYLRSQVTSCYSCPFAHLKSIGILGSDPEWHCLVAQPLNTPGGPKRVIGPERPEDGAPEWCPLKLQPILVHWKADA